MGSMKLVIKDYQSAIISSSKLSISNEVKVTLQMKFFVNKCDSVERKCSFKMVFKCQICSIDFSVEKEFTKHARSHNCFDCKQIFVSPQGKLDHVKKAHPVKTQSITKEVS